MEIFTLLVGIIGALAWTPFIIEKLSPVKIEGKLFSIYSNIGYYNAIDSTESTHFILKIGLISLNKDYNLRDFNMRLNFRNSGWKDVEIRNNRFNEFKMPDGSFKKLNVPKDNFLVNKMLLHANTSVITYISAAIKGNYDEETTQKDVIFLKDDILS